MGKDKEEKKDKKDKKDKGKEEKREDKGKEKAEKKDKKKDKKEKKPKLSKEEKQAKKSAKKDKKKNKKTALCSDVLNVPEDASREVKQHVQADYERSLRGEFGEGARIGAEEWAQAGTKAGIQVWRIEKFHVVAWPVESYGKFFNGDSYIVLHTKATGAPGKFQWDIYFWIGENSTQDEYGTAAIKTVELDNKLGGLPVQHREIQDFESDAFSNLFQPCIQIMKGGIESGFNHVKPTEYRPRLLHVKGRRTIRVIEVGMTTDSLNAGDVFVLDNGLTIYVWNGAQSSPRERMKGGQLATALHNERGAKPRIVQLEQGQGEDPEFWELLGGEGAISTAAEGGDDLEAEKDQQRQPALLKLSDASGSLQFTEVARGGQIRQNMLNTNDAYIFDSGYEIWAWIGKRASPNEYKFAMKYAQDYLVRSGRPAYFPISRVVEGGENEAFNAAFHAFA